MTLTARRKEFKDYFFDREEAARIVRFFNNELTHQLGELAGQPFKLERWQRRILRRFVGWRHRVTGYRKYRTLYLEVPRKNGKSILAAGLAIYFLDADREKGARVVCYAMNEEQAKEAVFDVATGMIEASKKLSLRITPFRKSMSVRKTASRFNLISGSKKGKHGKNLSALVGDEVHEWESRELYDALRTSMGTRTQPVEIYLTTAGFDRNSLCYEMHEWTEDVNAGRVEDPSHLGVIYAAHPDDDWTDEKVWAKANPNLGVSVRLDWLRSECEKAKKNPALENTFKRLHLNMWTEQDSRWLSIDRWDECKATYTEEEMLGRRCYAGFDLSSTQDVTALVLVFPPQEDISLQISQPKWRLLSYFFVPDDAIERRKEKRIPYFKWEKEGYMIKTPGARVNYGTVLNKMMELNDKFEIMKFSGDKWNATHLVTLMQDDGLDVEFWVQSIQSLNGPTKEFEGLVLSHEIEQDGNPVFRWMVKNLAVRSDSNGNLRPCKQKSKEKIDGVAAFLNALGRALLQKEGAYEERGIRTV